MPTDGVGAWPDILAPLITAPAAGLVSAVLGFSLQTSVFVSSTNTHAATDWEIRTAPNGGGTAKWSSLVDLTSKLLKIVPALALATGQTYYIRARFRGNSVIGPWSEDVVITT